MNCVSSCVEELETDGWLVRRADPTPNPYCVMIPIRSSPAVPALRSNGRNRRRCG
jgi:hypothetical protein